MSDPTVRRTTTDDWSVLRELRLSALRSDPQAFLANLAHEQEFAEDDWRLRASHSDSLMAFVDGKPVGMVALAPGQGPRREMVSLWTTPEARHHGVAAALVHGAMEAAREAEATELFVQVESHGDPAHRLYEHLGFKETGRRVAVPGRSDSDLIEMALPL